MKIVLYTIHCPACNILAKKLDAKNIKYEIVDDATELNMRGMVQFPLLGVDDVIYEYTDAVKFVNSYTDTM
mgnify:CR=1 FL=1